MEDAQKEIYNRKGKQRAENNDQEIQEDKKEEQSLRILRTITEVATRWVLD